MSRVGEIKNLFPLVFVIVQFCLLMNDLSAQSAIYESRIRDFEETFRTIILQKGLVLDVSLDPKLRVNESHALVNSDLYQINISGQLLAKYSIKPDTFDLILCHELGHILGGEPKQKGNPLYSSEGQADFFATAVCLPHLWNDGSNSSEFGTENSVVNPPIYCYSIHMSKRRLCKRVIEASWRVAKIYATEFSLPQPVKIHSLSSHKLKYRFFLTPQCRFHTFLAGLACVDLPMGDFGTPQLDRLCGAKESPVPRPFCWYR